MAVLKKVIRPFVIKKALYLGISSAIMSFTVNSILPGMTRYVRETI